MAWVVGIGIAMFLIFAFPRQMGMLILITVLGVAGIFAYVHQQNANRAREISLISSFARIDAAACSDPAYPIAVSFRNGTERTIAYISFTLAAYEPGFSGSRLSGYRSSDRIIRPGESYLACWGAPTASTNHDLGRYNWTANVSTARFQ